MTTEIWFLSRSGRGLSLRFASNAPAGSLDVRVDVEPGVETFGLPYETWASLAPGSVVVAVDDAGRRTVESLPPTAPPPGPWPVRKVKEPER